MKIKKAPLILAALMMLSGCRNSKPEKTVEIHNTVQTTTSETSAEELEKYIITCAELAYKTIHEFEDKLPTTMEVTNETMISDVMNYDMEIADDYSVYMQMMSIDLFELTVIRASEDNLSEVKQMLEDRRTYLREQAAYYPSQVAAADAAVVGEVSGVCYLICAENAADMEKSLMYYILRN